MLSPRVAVQKQEDTSESPQKLPAAMEISPPLHLPPQSSPRSARTGPIKTAGRVFVLDHTRWTPPMVAAVDRLLQKHCGKKDMLKLVDHEYAELVHLSASDPNSVLHPTTKMHISRYVSNRAKMLNAKSSLNISLEKLQQTQQTSVPVVTMEPALFNPPTPLTEESVERIVEGILVRQQQYRQYRQTKTCLACGQPKSRYETDRSSIHFFYQQGPVRYFYCSQNVHQLFAAEGLSVSKMPFEKFAQTEFFQRELEATKQRGEERLEKKRKRPETSQRPGRLCRFCHNELKQGPNSPHIHTGFPGVAGKYIYCPSKVHALYRGQGIEKEMTWKEFQKSPFYDLEKKRDGWKKENNQIVYILYS
ncbi:uncharacterized protein LOC121638449 isoform X2 [Melanotaenia boesemani]|uniref:uncharacterized protein LOC121638449 isoform X2 n=1 Tax=Melanotaenia boesemani TaxID=1250792 RepID=UPI001C05AEE2|nr:uncharacterized protein LOC121638449 isoform X2 [Melanotaenia boesemani]